MWSSPLVSVLFSIMYFMCVLCLFGNGTKVEKLLRVDWWWAHLPPYKSSRSLLGLLGELVDQSAELSVGPKQIGKEKLQKHLSNHHIHPVIKYHDLIHTCFEQTVKWSVYYSHHQWPPIILCCCACLHRRFRRTEGKLQCRCSDNIWIGCV